MNGNKLRELRENQGILQKQLAVSVGVSTSTIGMYEQNRREPDNNTLKKIANYFGVSTDYLLDNENSNIRNESKDKEALKNVLIESGYMKKGEDLSDEELRNLMEFVKTNRKYIKEYK